MLAAPPPGHHGLHVNGNGASARCQFRPLPQDDPQHVVCAKAQKSSFGLQTASVLYLFVQVSKSTSRCPYSKAPKTCALTLGFFRMATFLSCLDILLCVGMYCIYIYIFIRVCVYVCYICCIPILILIIYVSICLYTGKTGSALHLA